MTIEIALASPAAGFGDFERYPSLPAKAAVLLYTLAKSQACIDGNKRLALILTKVFIAINNGTFRGVDDEDLAARVLDAATSAPGARERVVDELAGWLETVIVEREEH